MTKCEKCGADVLLPFRCSYCEKYFCEAHRLAENHDCPEAPERTPLGSHQTKQLIAHMNKPKSEEVHDTIRSTFHPPDGKKITIIDEGALHYTKYETTVPNEVWEDKDFRKKIQKAKSVEEIEGVIFEFYEKYSK